MGNPFFLIMVFALSALAAGWLYPGDRTPDLVSTAVAGGEAKVLEESVKTVTATVAHVDPASGMITLKGLGGEFRAFATDEGEMDLLEVKAGNQVLEPGKDPVAAAREAATRFEPSETPAGGLVQLVEMTGTVDGLNVPQDLAPPKGLAEESATIKVPALKDL